MDYFKAKAWQYGPLQSSGVAIMGHFKVKAWLLRTTLKLRLGYNEPL